MDPVGATCFYQHIRLLGARKNNLYLLYQKVALLCLKTYQYKVYSWLNAIRADLVLFVIPKRCTVPPFLNMIKRLIESEINSTLISHFKIKIKFQNFE